MKSFILGFLVGGCVYLGLVRCTNTPVNPPPQATPAPAPAPVSNPSCASGTWCYSEYLKPLITDTMLKADFSSLCKSYAGLTDDQKRNVWVSLFRAVSYAESSWNPTEVYIESDGNPSVGLLQVSFTDAHDNGCAFQTAADVKNPLKNLACGVTIATKWIGRDKVAAGGSAGAWLGMSRYWSTMRKTNPRYSVTMSKFVCP